MIVIDKDNVSHKVRKHIISNDGEESVWCDDWYGRHVIGNDCNWESQQRISELEREKEYLEKIIKDMQDDFNKEIGKYQY